MKTTDWKFPFSSLPRWDVRDRIPYVYDHFLEIPQKDTLCCIYSIAEVSMCNYVGSLAILRNKENPELLLNITQSMGFCDNISVSANGNFIFLQPSLYDPSQNRIKRPVLILDIAKSAFAYVDTDNYNPCYHVAEVSDHVFQVVAASHQENDKRLMKLSKKKIDTDRLRWHDLAEWNTLPEMLFRKRRLGKWNLGGR